MIRGIHHASISTRNLDALLEFYCGLLGFERMTDYSWPQGTDVMDNIVGLKDSAARVVFIKAGNAFIEVFQYTNPEPLAGDRARRPCDPAITHICFDVLDVLGEYERLRAAGVFFHSAPQTTAGLCTVYGRDPDGNIFELQELLNPKSRMQLPAHKAPTKHA